MAKLEIDAKCADLLETFSALDAEKRKRLIAFAQNLGAAQRNGNSDLLSSDLRRAERVFGDKPITGENAHKIATKWDELAAYYARDTGSNIHANSEH